jgi:hypothetical protein
MFSSVDFALLQNDGNKFIDTEKAVNLNAADKSFAHYKQNSPYFRALMVVKTVCAPAILGFICEFVCRADISAAAIRQKQDTRPSIFTRRVIRYQINRAGRRWGYCYPDERFYEKLA